MRNPKTGKEMFALVKSVPHFKAGKGKEQVNDAEISILNS